MRLEAGSVQVSALASDRSSSSPLEFPGKTTRLFVRPLTTRAVWSGFLSATPEFRNVP
jgi:hypothetical protein